jgi:hypothetical protein
VSIRTLRVKNGADLRNKFAGPLSVLLSVSVPYQRQAPLDSRNQYYLDTAEPVRIRSAVVALTRTMLLRNVRLVFGAHPSISPIVLDTAREVSLFRDREGEGWIRSRRFDSRHPLGARVLIFQSAYFERDLPQSTLQLASWDAGALVLTPAMSTKEASLQLMREMMISIPGLCAAIFIGGMEGVEEEARLFREHTRERPMYAIASTGSAARKLWIEAPERYSGRLESPHILLENSSYTVLASDILSDLGFLEPL